MKEKMRERKGEKEKERKIRQKREKKREIESKREKRRENQRKIEKDVKGQSLSICIQFSILNWVMIFDNFLVKIKALVRKHL